MEGRDLLGYGEQRPSFEWPNGTKLAISFVLNYEEGGEHTILNEDSHSEIYLNEVPGLTPKQNKRDLSTESYFEYGSRVGVHRILDLFKSYNYPMTLHVIGRAAELNPLPLKRAVADGHELCSHHYRWIDYDSMPEEEEIEHIEKCIEAIKSVNGGETPVGWYTGRNSSEQPERLLKVYSKHNTKLLYEADAYNDDLPYYRTVASTPYLVIPYTLDNNDMKFHVSPGFTTSDHFFNYLKDSLLTGLHDVKLGKTNFLSIGLHCRIIGKPGRFMALVKFLEFLKNYEAQVWVTRRKDIANFWWEKFPPKV